jgi:nitrate/nitrite-specific signal transduction histidine kinase
MVKLIGGLLILLACIGLVFMIWSFFATVLFPWADRMRAGRDPVQNRVFLDDILKDKE